MTHIDDICDELITDNFVWTDYDGKLHINLPYLEERLNRVGLTVVKLREDKDD